ncbi:MAG: hypothetical protein R3330_14785, partial [Saprospiraceae bacterium]|nr:hypothetical protein [Saprospiraceae bacterium]
SGDYYISVTDPDAGDYANVQVSGDVLRSDTMRITYNRAGTIVNAKLSVELRDLDYKESPDDREVTALTGALRRRVSPLVSAGLTGRYTRTERTDINTTDKLYVIGGDVSFRLSKKLAANLDLRYQDKNATDSIDEYTEFSVFAGISYNIFQK